MNYLTIYLIASLLVAIFTIVAGNRVDFSVPVGDCEYYEEGSLFSLVNFLFLPSIAIVLVWMGFVAIVNAVRY